LRLADRGGGFADLRGRLLETDEDPGGDADGQSECDAQADRPSQPWSLFDRREHTVNSRTSHAPT
jgi:hypothetical protein